MRHLASACALTSLALIAGCGSDSAPSTAASSPAGQSTVTTTGPPAGSAATSVLTGTVGSADDPDAFVITLTDSSGSPVTTLSAGTYSIQVQDLSEIHNFHLTGGAVDETTTVPEVTDTTFDVTLTPGAYTFVCDPHPRMVGTFTVT